MRSRWIWPAAWIVALAALFVVRMPDAGIPSKLTVSSIEIPAPSADEEAGVPRNRRADSALRRPAPPPALRPQGPRHTSPSRPPVMPRSG
ncbi:MAG: hypothetical protein ACRDF6_06055, partial [bacterium]